MVVRGLHQRGLHQLRTDTDAAWGTGYERASIIGNERASIIIGNERASSQEPETPQETREQNRAHRTSERGRRGQGHEP